MSPRRLTVLAALALVIVPLSYGAAAFAPPPPVPGRPGYPQLANYSGSTGNGLREAWQVPFFATYGLVIAGRGAPVRLLKRADPQLSALLYERTLQGPVRDQR